jgi:hypothetical protein
VTSKIFIDSLVFEIVLSFFFLIHLFSQSWLWNVSLFLWSFNVFQSSLKRKF